MPRVLNRHRDRIPKDAVYCGRGSKYGNPFRIGPDGDRTEVLKKFEKLVLPNLDVSALRGKDLVCFCAPKPCHCDLLLEKANGIKIVRFKDMGPFKASGNKPALIIYDDIEIGEADQN